jgi:hypothetical protein
LITPYISLSFSYWRDKGGTSTIRKEEFEDTKGVICWIKTIKNWLSELL